jgi:hypothetical protein
VLLVVDVVVGVFRSRIAVVVVFRSGTPAYFVVLVQDAFAAFVDAFAAFGVGVGGFFSVPFLR